MTLLEFVIRAIIKENFKMGILAKSTKASALVRRIGRQFLKTRFKVLISVIKYLFDT